MMAQEMYEKVEQLEREVDLCRNLIQEWLPYMASKMQQEFEDLVNGLPSSVVEDDEDDDEACEDCLMWLPQCKCEENANDKKN